METSDDNINDFLRQGNEDEFKTLVSVSDKKEKFGWQDVKDNNEDFSLKLWGTAIEYGILNAATDSKYTLEARSEISQYLSGNWNSSTEDIEGTEVSKEEVDMSEIDFEKSKWSIIDKLVALVAVASVLGFGLKPVQRTISGLLDIILNPLMQFLPFLYVIFILAVIGSIWTTLVREKILDLDVGKFREAISKLRGDGGMLSGADEDISEDKERKIMQLQQSMMKSQMKPIAWSAVLTIPLIIWIVTTADFGGVGTVNYPIFGENAWSGNITRILGILPIKTWIPWYASISIVLSQVLKKL